MGKRKRKDVDVDIDIDWEDKDVWSEVTKWMKAKSIITIAAANEWFANFLTSNHIWKNKFLRDLKIDFEVKNEGFSWLQLYEAAICSNAFTFRLSGKALRLEPNHRRAMLFESHDALLTQLNGTEKKLEDGFNIKVEKIKTGIWIYENFTTRCLRHRDACDCLGFSTSFDARHIELFLMGDYTDGTWKYERIDKKVCNGNEEPRDEDESVGITFDWGLSIFDLKHISEKAAVADTFFPVEDRRALRAFSHGISYKIDDIRGDYESTRTEYHKMRDNNGEVVAIRAYLAKSIYLDDGADWSLLY